MPEKQDWQGSNTDKTVLRALIEQADVFIHSMRPKAVARLGFSYDEVAAINPAIVYTNCYGYSRRGPNGDLPAYDDTIQAACGLPFVQEQLTGEPNYVDTILADKVAGPTALCGLSPHGRSQPAAVPHQ